MWLTGLDKVYMQAVTTIKVKVYLKWLISFPKSKNVWIQFLWETASRYYKEMKTESLVRKLVQES